VREHDPPFHAPAYGLFVLSIGKSPSETMSFYGLIKRIAKAILPCRKQRFKLPELSGNCSLTKKTSFVAKHKKQFGYKRYGMSRAVSAPRLLE